MKKDVTYHLTSDGVLIDTDEYFQTLEPQTSVMMVLKEQNQNIKTGWFIPDFLYVYIYIFVNCLDL